VEPVARLGTHGGRMRRGRRGSQAARACVFRQIPAPRTGGSPEMLISPVTCRLDRCSRTSILGVSICGLHRVPSAGSAIGVGVTLSGVEGLKICGGTNGAPLPSDRPRPRGVLPPWGWGRRLAAR
jgi:hypothetical protein